jgi:acetolactate synthase-1/2/3 large subunit
VGFGARSAASWVVRLAESSGAPVLCSPRGKGIMPENHPLFVGVSGLGGDSSVHDYLREHTPDWLLVLGTRLGEPTSFWDEGLLPARGIIHVDRDPTVPGSAYPDADVITIGIQADIGAFLEALMALPLSGKGSAATSMKLLEIRAPSATPCGAPARGVSGPVR